MPKVTYTNEKGLVQESGAGFAINHIEASPTNTLDDNSFLTVFTGAATPTLPATADTGTIKLIILDTAADVVLQAANCTTGAVTLTNIGDMALCVFDGTEWVVGRSLG
jgi:hypothetical protein